VVLSSVGDIPTVVEAMRRGAEDYLTKEATREEIALRLRNILRQGRLAHEVHRLRRSLDRFQDFEEIIGQSASIGELKKTIAEVAPSSVSVLITGETGVGKELVARAIHRMSPRASEPFVEVNCAALPDENLFLSELFGHERGAFTGAVSRKRGHFELADGGTLFLDEVGELGPLAQARLLRAVETLQFHRVGGERPIRVNCRLIFATNKQLEKEVEAERFRRDLFYRINVCPLQVPPLRSHPEDIASLVRFFAARMADKHGLPPLNFAEDALAAFKANPWPGNVRELRNVIERVAIRFAGKTVDAKNLRELNFQSGDALSGAIVLPEGGIDLAEVEKGLVIQALQRANWSQRDAAHLLGISVDRMNARVRKFGITHPSWRVHK
ncbi:sigma-54-dependent Fis family transcriptional regulator, partial [Candidatus Sumerlaeota bacterium]|nr:sigma-54-dependent Fis family transcriptional regulator [Candidatus Sumerlaeota bacterium]